MGAKFTSQDLFRIAQENLSAVDAVEFRFVCATAEFREAIGDVFTADIDLDTDERNLLEKIVSKLSTRSLLRGGR